MRPSPTTICSLRSFCTIVSEVVRIRSPVPKTGANVYSNKQKQKEAMSQAALLTAEKMARENY